MQDCYIYCIDTLGEPQTKCVFCCRAFTLVGDHYQLPPLVTSREAEEGGLGISLFKRLCDSHPQVSCALHWALWEPSRVVLACKLHASRLAQTRPQSSGDINSCPDVLTPACCNTWLTWDRFNMCTHDESVCVPGKNNNFTSCVFCTMQHQ